MKKTIEFVVNYLEMGKRITFVNIVSENWNRYSLQILFQQLKNIYCFYSHLFTFFTTNVACTRVLALQKLTTNVQHYFNIFIFFRQSQTNNSYNLKNCQFKNWYLDFIYSINSINNITYIIQQLLSNMKKTSSQLFQERISNSSQEMISEVFTRYDKNCNGVLSKAEFPHAFNYLLALFDRQPICNEDIIDIFDYIDLNGDDNISKDQFRILVSKIIQAHKYSMLGEQIYSSLEDSFRSSASSQRSNK